MIIGIPREIKSGENRVAFTPQAVETLKLDGHQIMLERDAGNGSGFSNEEYKKAGANIVEDHASVYKADLIIKVKELLPQEYELLKEGRIIMTYLHLTEGLLGSKRPLVEALLKNRIVAFSYDTVQLDNGLTPLLAPMSEIAGHNGVIMGAYFLQAHFGGKGIMFGRMTGCRPAEIVIIGGGSVGTGAAKAAIGLGANVTMLDVNMRRLNELQEVFRNNIVTLYSDKNNIRESVKKADVVLNAVFFNPLRTRKHIVTKKMVKCMQPGSVIVDIGCDENGPIETCRETYHNDPIYIRDGVVHYCVPNIPGAVPRTASLALSNAVLPYVMELANKGWVKAVKEDPSLMKGLNVAYGKVVNREVAACQKMEWTPLDKLLKTLNKTDYYDLK